MNKLFGLVERIVTKLTSGKFLCLVGIIFTYCFIINKCLGLFSEGKIEKDIILMMLTGLVSSASTIITFYYSKK